MSDEPQVNAEITAQNAALCNLDHSYSGSCDGVMDVISVRQ